MIFSSTFTIFSGVRDVRILFTLDTILICRLYFQHRFLSFRFTQLNTMDKSKEFPPESVQRTCQIKVKICNKKSNSGFRSTTVVSPKRDYTPHKIINSSWQIKQDCIEFRQVMSLMVKCTILYQVHI